MRPEIKTIASTQELRYQVTGSQLLYRQIKAQFLKFEEVYSPRPIAESESLKWAPCGIIGEMEEIDQIRRSIFDPAKSRKPQFGYRESGKEVTEKLNDMPIFTENLKNHITAAYAKFGKGELLNPHSQNREKSENN